MEPLAAFWEKWGATEGMTLAGPGRLPDWLWEEEGKGKEGTLLMVATVAGQDDIVRWLLEDKKADPTVPVPTPTLNLAASTASTPVGSDAEGEEEKKTRKQGTFRTAYDLSPNRTVRSTFRRAAHSFPDLWDWTSLSPGGARVPSGLSAEMEEDQAAKKGERRKGLKEKMAARRKKEEEEELEVEPEVVVEKKKVVVQSAKPGQPQRLGGGGADGTTGGTTGGLNGLSAEVRMRIERERRARAAEARMAKLG